MKKALLYACIEKNIGDDLFIYTLCKRYPNCNFYISSEAKYGSLREIKNLRFSHIFNIWQKASNTGNRKGIKLLASKIIAAICSIYLKQFSTSVYVVGNAFKNYEYKGTRQSEWFKHRVSLTKSFFLLSTNFGPFADDQWVTDFKKHFSKGTHICFRDETSFDLFQDLENVDWAPDVVLSLGNQEKSEKLNKEQVLISVIDCGFETRPQHVKKRQYEYENKMIQLSNYYLNKGYKVKILTSNNQQDYPTAKRIQNECSNQLGIMPEIVEYDGDYNKVFQEYKDSKYVIATRLHAIILAWLYNVPVVPIIYDVKIKTLLDSYKFNGLSFDLQSIDDISVEQVDHALKNYRFKNLNNLFREANNQFKVLDKLLK
ncbi:polysaccharide pyruvyl transferase family protein [Bacillus salacetis]|uniref:Polysaccharide pyruvyl transferase family protein n=1 Tax=Bacillus salacetis TaxID=2315464 RepID=A0A3A1R8A5_9BACI|nr:polysaccharide pyruvyl transferase family protein [Bacillus salacetis]RIW36051.1 polysaccharide pyruvyl transferase family protein [Bacillus salacetis]